MELRGTAAARTVILALAAFSCIAQTPAQVALVKLEFDVASVRQGKYFALALADGLDEQAARTQVERIAREVLTNPVIEEFTYRIEG